MGAIIAAVALTAVWLGALGLARQGYPEGGYTGMPAVDNEGSRRFLIRPFRLLLERSGTWDRLQPVMTGLHGKLFILTGGAWTVEATRQYAAFVIGCGYSAALAGAWLAVLSGERLLLAIGALLAAVIPAAKWRDAGSRVHRRKQDIVLALPELLDKLMLLIGAGETVQRALARCAERRSAAEDPLLRELRRAVEEVRNGDSFAAAMEAFSRRCAVQEVSVFTTTLLLNYRRGGDRLALSLKELSYTLWEKRKVVARTRGEEASSKLVFPLVMVFLILMVLVASPAVLMLGG